MPWVRSATWLLASASVLSCTRSNPAFETSADDEAAASESDSDGGETDVRDLGTAAECMWDEGVDLFVKLPQPCGETNENTQRYERSFLVVSETNNGWLGGLCSDPLDLDCTGDCPTDVPQAIEVGPFDVGGLAGAGACLRVKSAQRDPATESCSFDAIGIWSGATPIVIASNGSAVIGEALDDAGLIAVSPTLAEDPACECVEDCCASSPGDYALEANGQLVTVGNSAQLAGHPYEFHALHAYNPTGCTTDLKQAWALTYSQ